MEFWNDDCNGKEKHLIKVELVKELEEKVVELV
jgi:hypothetical protein